MQLDLEADVRRREARLLAVQVLAGVLPGREGPAEEGAACEREARQGVDGRLRGRLVAAVFRAALVEVAVLAQPDDGAIVDTSHDVGDVGLRGRRRLVYAYALAVLLEDGVDAATCSSLARFERNCSISRAPMSLGCRSSWNTQ